MIDRTYYVYDENLSLHTSYGNEDDAREYAAQRSEENEEFLGVMLMVPVTSGFPELRAIAVYDHTGRCIWETDVYEPELVG